MKTLTILIGVPGSGKSSYAKHLETLGYTRVSQDANKGNKSKTTEQFIQATKENKDIVLDRCNINKDQRRVWINKAMAAGYDEIIGVSFSTDTETCISRVLARKDHETIKDMPEEKVRSIVEGFASSFEAPSFQEGFTALVQK